MHGQFLGLATAVITLIFALQALAKIEKLKKEFASLRQLIANFQKQ
jgi:hypothetical protein